MSYQPDLYDVVTSPMLQGDVDSYVVERGSGGSVLELGAGTGRVTLMVAAAGVPIHALDSSQFDGREFTRDGEELVIEAS